MPGLIYLVQPTDCIGTSVYKIGMSKNNTIKRIRSYGPRCINIISRECTNPAELEQQLIKTFQAEFGLPVQGREWFRGDKLAMINTFDECIKTHAKYSNNNPVDVDSFSSNELMTYIQRHIEFTRHRTDGRINDRCYELMNILPDTWFSNKDCLWKIVHALRNELLVPEDLIATMRGLFYHRVPNYYEGFIISYLNSQLTYSQQRFGLCALSKIIKKEFPDEYDEWLTKWMPKKTIKRKLKMVYKEGSLTKLSDLKAIYKGELTAEKLLKMNRGYTICKKHICKSCMGLYIIGCCDKYARKNNTTCQFVNNIELK